MSKHFIVVLVSQPNGRWRAHIPDLPGCRAEGERVEFAVRQAATAAIKLIARLRQAGEVDHAPRTLEEIHADVRWAGERILTGRR